MKSECTLVDFKSCSLYLLKSSFSIFWIWYNSFKINALFLASLSVIVTFNSFKSSVVKFFKDERNELNLVCSSFFSSWSNWVISYSFLELFIRSI